MGSHTQPTPEQLKPMVEAGRAYWASFTKAAAIGAACVIVLLALMAVFLVKHP